MNRKLAVTVSTLSLTVAVGLGVFNPLRVHAADDSFEQKIMAVPYNNPVEARRAGFPTHALNINRAADGTLSRMLTPDEVMRERSYNKLYLGPARKRVAASITDGQSKTASKSLFGVADTSTTTIAGISFQPRTQATTFTRDSTEGDFTCPNAEGTDEYIAQVSLPSGALVTSIRAYGSDTSAADDANYFLVASCDAGASPVETTVATASVTTGFPGGRYTVNSSAVSHTVDNSDCIYFVRADMSEGTCDGANLVHQVLIRWKRQISPDPGTTTFTDVPLAHPFHREIEALVASGITGGCGGSNYCPDATLTRGQMAAFLSRALGLHWESN